MDNQCYSKTPSMKPAPKKMLKASKFAKKSNPLFWDDPPSLFNKDLLVMA